jgi:hypothetical protein
MASKRGRNVSAVIDVNPISKKAMLHLVRCPSLQSFCQYAVYGVVAPRILNLGFRLREW